MGSAGANPYSYGYCCRFHYHYRYGQNDDASTTNDSLPNTYNDDIHRCYCAAAAPQLLRDKLLLPVREGKVSRLLSQDRLALADALFCAMENSVRGGVLIQLPEKALV